MDATSQVTSPSKGSIWTGRVISALIVLFLLFDSVLKFMKPAPVVETFAHLGLSMSLANPLGIILIVCALLYAIPQTSILGAILLTAYLGGAVCTHLRAGDPLFSHVLFPTYMGALLWLAIYLRDVRLHALIPFRS